MIDLSKEKISKALNAYQVQEQPRFEGLFSPGNFKEFRQAAVFIPILRNDGRWHVLLIRRSEALVEHRGQVAFPGGAREHGDADLLSTARREMYEEVGVHSNEVEVFGELGDMPVITGYLVRIFVGQIPWPYDLMINGDEVESAFIVPLDWLVDPDHRTIKYRSYQGRQISVIFFDHYEGHQLWGASAEMTLALLSALDLAD